MIHLRAIYSRRLLLALRARVWCSAALRVAEAPSTFEREIVTILRTHGLKCHSGSSPKNDLDLTHRDGQEVGDGIAVQVRRAFRLAFQRDPTEREAAAAEKWVRKHDLVPLCRALFNANEFILVN